MVMECNSFKGRSFDAFLLSQIWDCREDRNQIFQECRYQVVATDMLAALLALEQADLDMDFLEALSELYPAWRCSISRTAESWFWAKMCAPTSSRGGPLHPFRRQCPLLQHSGCEDMLIDTVGMGTLFLPDLQYHFRGMDPNWMVNHAYNRRHSGCAHSAETEWWHGQIHRNMDCATLWKEKARMGYMDSTKLCG